MKYRDLVQFEPIRTVIQIQEAEQLDRARELVRTFVISEQIGEAMTDLVFPKLQYTIPSDNMGLFVVGNYGTGKSHLMAVISAIAEREDLVDYLTSETVKESADPIAGKFVVCRAELAGTTFDLGEWLFQTLGQFLEQQEVSFTFPSPDKILNLKQVLTEMMSAFEAKYPDKGLLLVIDELLDYLRELDDQRKIRCFNVLRVLGEFCAESRFRVIAGVQESLFDSPSFSFAAESLRRVRDRFEQVYIQREDIAYVVKQRLLKKTHEQRSWIRAHLEKFVSLYSRMNEQMEEFVQMFPVHPRYIEVFGQIRIAEKREVLRTLSDTIDEMLNNDVPEMQPGVIAYDSYWKRLSTNPSFRTQPEIREVIDKSQMLADRILTTFRSERRYRSYLAIAERIVHALSIHRLTTVDVHVESGPTAAELRDELCLWLPVPEQNAEFLENMIYTTLQNMWKAVGGELLGRNTENNQFFLRLEGIDPMAKIEERAATLSNDEKDRAYFTVLADLMECSERTYRPSFKIWEHELTWEERNVGRPGYLFFGAPNERSTTHPIREFYLHFLALFNPVGFDTQATQPKDFADELQSDEIFFILKPAESMPTLISPNEGLSESEDDTFEAFTNLLQIYEASRYLQDRAQGGLKTAYSDKGMDARRKAAQWLYENMGKVFSVRYKGKDTRLANLITGRRGGDDSFRGIVNHVAASLLQPYFQERLPHYPTFGVRITRENRMNTAQEALIWITGGLKTKQGAAVLEALGLLNEEGNAVSVRNSLYAQAILNRLKDGQVVNRHDILTGEADAESDDNGLEPEWVAVVLLALVYTGDIVITPRTGQKVDASNLAPSISIDKIANFKHIQKPIGFPESQLSKLFEILQLPPGLVKNPDTRDDAVKQLQNYVPQKVPELVEMEANLQELSLWNERILTDETRDTALAPLRKFKDFLASLRPYNTVGKLRAFKYSTADVEAQQDNLAAIAELKSLKEIVTELTPSIFYLEQGMSSLPDDHQWRTQASAVRESLVDALRSSENLSSLRMQARQQFENLKRDYKKHYIGWHNKSRLTHDGDARKKRLMDDSRLTQLRSLMIIPFLTANQLHAWEEKLGNLKPCVLLAESEIETSPICPHCNFRPRDEKVDADVKGQLDDLETQLDDIYREWTQTLLDNLKDPTVEANISLLDAEEQQTVQHFLREKQFPYTVDSRFVRSVSNALDTLEKVSVSEYELLSALKQGGMPCSVEEFKERFDKIVKQKTRGKSLDKVRIVLE